MNQNKVAIWTTALIMGLMVLLAVGITAVNWNTETEPSSTYYAPSTDAERKVSSALSCQWAGELGGASESLRACVYAREFTPWVDDDQAVRDCLINRKMDTDQLLAICLITSGAVRP